MKTKTALAIVIILCAAHTAPAQSDTNSFINKIIQIERLISEHYADTVDRNKLMEITIRAVFGHLDPHTVYKTPQEAKDEQTKYGAEHIGIGAKAARLNDTLVIIEVDESAAAYKAGLRKHMRIDSVNGQPVTNRILTSEQLLKIINMRDDSINMSIIRGKGRKKITIPRSSIRNSSIESSYTPNDSTTYIKITNFNKYTSEDFDKILRQTEHKKLRNVIIDLRDNPGGHLQACQKICNHIIPANMLLYTTINSHGESAPIFADELGMLKKSRIYILINENSASASEVIASCIQDNDRGIIIGRRSFGKALTQIVTIMPDGSKILVSNGRIYSPSGRCIQKDYTRGNFAEYHNELSQRKKRRENIYRDSINTDGKPTHKTIIKHRTVHGHAGVIPDYFVPEDSTNVTTTQSSDGHNIYNDMWGFALLFVDAQHQRLETKYRNYKTYRQSFHVSDSMLDDFIQYRQDQTHSLRKTTEAKTPSTSGARHLRIQLKAFIAKALYGPKEFRTLINEDDSDFQAAIHLITNPQEYWNYLQ